METITCLMRGGDLIACTWALTPWWFQVGAWACLALLLGGAVMNLAALAKKVAGWPGFAAVLGFAGLVAALVTFRRRPGSDLFAADTDGEAPSRRGSASRPAGPKVGESLVE